VEQFSSVGIKIPYRNPNGDRNFIVYLKKSSGDGFGVQFLDIDFSSGDEIKVNFPEGLKFQGIFPPGTKFLPIFPVGMGSQWVCDAGVSLTMELMVVILA